MNNFANPFNYVQKGLCQLLTELLVCCSRLDTTDDTDIKQFYGRFVQVRDLFEIYAQIEQHLLPPLLTRDGTDNVFTELQTARQSHQHTWSLLNRQLEDWIHSQPGIERGQLYYFCLCRFVGELLHYIADKEMRIQPILRRSCSAQQMLAIHVGIRQMFPPAVLRLLLPSMITAANESERSNIMLHLHQTLTGAAYAQTCDLLESKLSRADWQSLRAIVTAGF